MCIMEVRSNQHSSTIAQACAHNIGTVVGDLKMFRELVARRDPAMLERLDSNGGALEACYDALPAMYGEFVGREIHNPHAYIIHADCDGEIGSERVIEQVEEQDIARSSRYETR